MWYVNVDVDWVVDRKEALGIAARRGKEVDVCWEQLRWSTSFSFQSVGLVGPRYKKGCCVTSVAIATAAGTTAG